MIEHIFGIIGEGTRRCVEFGAADGSSCSNTRKLWEQGWTALLVEGDTDCYAALKETLLWHPNCISVNTYLTPTGPESIDNILAQYVFAEVDLISIDVDGLDYDIWAAMDIRPRVICIEYNQSIPPQFSVRQKNPRESFGASALALVDLAHDKGYELVGMNKANLFFVVQDEAQPFVDYGHLSELFPCEDLCYVATDYQGRPLILGGPPWGLSETPFIGETYGGYKTVGPYWDLIKVLEAEVGSHALVIGQDWEVSPSRETEAGVAAYRRVFDLRSPLVIIDIANQADVECCRWVETVSKEYGFKMRIIGKELVVFTRDTV